MIAPHGKLNLYVRRATCDLRPVTCALIEALRALQYSETAITVYSSFTQACVLPLSENLSAIGRKIYAHRLRETLPA